MSEVYRPLLNFMIVGAQKCGTTALVQFLGQHPRIRLSSVKEPHLFDAPDYSPDWSPEQIDQRYRPYFNFDSPDGTPPSSQYEPPASQSGTPAEPGTPTFQRESQSGTPTFQSGTPVAIETPTLERAPIGGLTRGEATPIYLFLPEIVPELKRYNPDLKVVVLLRDPVQRAISHYYMEMNKGYEKLPLWLALLCESWRLRRCGNPRRHGSAWRRHSYRRRGLYSLQLRNLFRYFDAGQVLLVRSEDLTRHHDAVLNRIFGFLDVGAHEGIEARTIFEGERDGRRHRVVSGLLRASYVREFIRMRRFEALQH